MKTTITILSLLLLMALGGCSTDTSTGTPDNETSQVPASVQELLVRHAVPLAIPTTDNDLAQPGVAPADPPYEHYDVYAVTLLWGSLTNTTPTPGPTVDWSGTAGINGVATINVTHTIDFEAAQDSLIPTNNPAMAAWVSKTANDFDGLNLLIYVDRNIVYVTAPVFTLATAAITKTFPIGELANLMPITSSPIPPDWQFTRVGSILRLVPPALFPANGFAPTSADNPALSMPPGGKTTANRSAICLVISGLNRTANESSKAGYHRAT